MWHVVRIILGIFAVVLTALYYTGIKFTLYDEETKNAIRTAGGGPSFKPK